MIGAQEFYLPLQLHLISLDLLMMNLQQETGHAHCMDKSAFFPPVPLNLSLHLELRLPFSAYKRYIRDQKKNFAS